LNLNRDKIKIKVLVKQMMGAVHAKIKLTNAVDEELVNRGLLAPRLLREHETQGLVDTGAVSLVISTEIVEQLGLRIRGQRPCSIR
jgi:hypothetical protein